MRIVATVAIVLVLFGCSRERLKNENADLIGTDEWVSSTVTHHGSASWSTVEIPPYNEVNSCRIEILKKGVLKVSINGECIEKHRILEATKYASCGLEACFELNLSGHNKSCIIGYYGEIDSCVIGLFPFQNEGNISYANQFVRR